jgi:predicted TPR repeat methyltransferase
MRSFNQQGIVHMQKARPHPIATSPAFPAASDTTLQRAIEAHQAGRLGEAGGLYRAFLDKNPYHPDALHFFGMLRHQLGHSAIGLELIKRALFLAPEYVDARNNLGNIQKHLGMAAEAEASYRKVLAARPDFTPALNNLGVTLRRQGRLAEAIAVFRRCLELAPEFAACLSNLSRALNAAGEREEAITNYRKLVLLTPHDVQTYRHLADGLIAVGREQEAIEVYREWAKIAPDNAEIAHMIAACSGENVPERANDDYVETLFDGFAGSFDAILKKLEYQAPSLCGALVRELYGPPTASLDILDAGCGTGLCAPFLSPFARALDGVDLSPKMLERAQQRGGYRILHAAELTAWLSSHCDHYDLIVSADTLCYFGKLDEVAKAAYAALRSNGNFVFTLEAISASVQEPPSFRLNPHGRYSHAETYARQALADAGFPHCFVQHVQLRTQDGNPVAGLLIAAQREQQMKHV